MKKIILEVDENKDAQLLKLDSMDHMETINLLLATAVWYYKEYCGIDSINEATREVGAGLIKSVEGRF